MSKEDGGQAFPPNAGWRDDDPACRGMTLRDYFAAAALTGLIAAYGGRGQHIPDEKFAEFADNIANAMIARRATRAQDKDA